MPHASSGSSKQHPDWSTELHATVQAHHMSENKQAGMGKWEINLTGSAESLITHAHTHTLPLTFNKYIGSLTSTHTCLLTQAAEHNEAHKDYIL